MKAKIIDKSELKKTQLQREAEEVLGQLTTEKAIEITPGNTPVSTVRRAFRLAATSLGIEIRMRKKGDGIYVLRK